MGTPSITQGATIYFETEEQAANAFDILEKWIKNVESSNCDESLKGDYCIHSLEQKGYCIYFVAESGRVQNLQWQLENFRDAAKELEGCCEFSADIVILESDNGVYWSKDEELDS